MKLALSLFISVLLIVLPAYADDAAVRKYRDYTPQRLSSLSKEKLKSEVPMMYTMAAQRGLSVGSNLLFGMELNQLMYPGLHDYSSAVKAFQVDLGDKPQNHELHRLLMAKRSLTRNSLRFRRLPTPYYQAPSESALTL